MQENNEFFFWIKGDVYSLDKDNYFKTSEFTCHCKNKSCKEQKISKELISKLVELRKTVNEPLIVTSGFRCAEYQDQLRRQGENTVVAKKSQHEEGCAADVKPTRMKIPVFLNLVAKLFKSIGIASTFLHLDLRSDKERRWNY